MTPCSLLCRAVGLQIGLQTSQVQVRLPGRDYFGDVAVDRVYFELQEDQPLLVAIDFTDTPASDTAYSGTKYKMVTEEEGVAYWPRLREHGAALPNRAADYEQDAAIYFIEKIEVDP